MTPQQIELARHALGLPNRYRRSYRNSFVTGPGCADHAAWMAMVDAGDATRMNGARLPFGGDDKFMLTHAGAYAALAKGERLHPDYFPRGRP